MNVDGYRTEWTKVKDVIDKVEGFPDAPDGLCLTVHTVLASASLHGSVQTVEELKDKLSSARAYYRECLGAWTDEVVAIRKWDHIHIEFGNDTPFGITIMTDSEDVLKLFAKDGCEFVVNDSGSPMQTLVCSA